MPPIELWGPATWTLFHVLAEKVNEHMYPRIAGQLFDVIKRICSALPCPECAQDATIFLAKIKVHELKTKMDFKNMIYVFHNYVNTKKRKPLFKYINLEVYKTYNIVYVFNKFISFYHTKGNMRLLAESFQRQLIVKNVREWFTRNLGFFMPCNQPVPNVEEPTPVLNEVLNEPEVSVNSETPFLSPSDVLSEATVSEATVSEATVSVEESVESETTVIVESETTEIVESEATEIVESEATVSVKESVESEATESVKESVESEATVSVESEATVSVESEATVSEANVDEVQLLEENNISLNELKDEPAAQAPEVEPDVVPEVEASKPKRGRKKKTA